MYYKLPQGITERLVFFIADATRDDRYYDACASIKTMAFKCVSEGTHCLIPVSSVKDILRLSGEGEPFALENLKKRRNSIIMELFECELVGHQDKAGHWKVEVPGRDGESVLIKPNDYWEIKALYDSGKQKIPTIKAIRMATGLGLKEAKEMYEQTFHAARKI